MELLVLNTDFESVKIVDTFKSVIWTDRYDSIGDFDLCLSMDQNMLKYLKEDYYLYLHESERCMIIENISISSDVEEGDNIIVTGRSLESLLERRIVWGQKEMIGNLQIEIQSLINEAIIFPVIDERKINNFIFEESTDPRVTELTVDAQFTGDDLYSVIKKLCQLNNLGFKIVLNSTNQFVFSLYAGVDRSYDQTGNPYVIFSPDFDNIINSNYYTSKANLKNVTLVVGEGEGVSRKTTTVGFGSGLDRREIFTDAQNISANTENGTLTNEEYLTKLKTKGNENLSAYIYKTAFEGEVEATRLFKYGEDFFIGDTVQIANEYGHEGKAYISELILSQSEDGIFIYPTFQTIQERGDENT